MINYLIPNLVKNVEAGLACAIMDFNLGIEEKIKPYVKMSVSDEIKQFKYLRSSRFIELGRTIV